MTAALLISVYLAIGLLLRPYTRDFSLWQGVLLHIFWLPAMITRKEG